MKTQNRLVIGAVCFVLVSGCHSMDILKDEPQPDSKGDAPTVELGIRYMMTMPRPRPPRIDPLALDPRLPEPGIPALSQEPAVDGQSPLPEVADSLPAAPPIRPENADQHAVLTTTASLPYVPTKGRGYRVPAAIVPRAPIAPRTEFALERSGRFAVRQSAPPQLGEVEVGPVAAAPAAQALRTGASKPSAPAAVDGPPPAAATKAIEEPRRLLLARRGDAMAIDLEGNGWIYVGSNADEQGIDFISRRNYQDRTSFNFKAAEYGEYELAFQNQDNQRAVLHSQVIGVHVLPDQDFTAALERQQKEADGLSMERTTGLRRASDGRTGLRRKAGPPIEAADTLFDLGQFELALIEYKRNMRPGDPYISDRLAACYAQTGEYLAAAKYFRENLGLEGEYGERAAVGLVRSSVALQDSRTLMEVLPSLLNLDSAQIDAELLEIARFQTRDRQYSVAIQALKQYIQRYPAGRSLDEVYFRLARIYEVDSPYRDLEKALEYYRLLYDLFPESLYVDQAEERIKYLNRHFFLIQ